MIGKLPTFKQPKMHTMGQPLQTMPAQPQMIPNPMAQGLPNFSQFNNKLYPGTQWIMQQPGVTGGAMTPNPAYQAPAQPQNPAMPQMPQQGGGNQAEEMARRAWSQARPQWNNYDGSRDQFLEARSDWRGLKPTRQNLWTYQP